LNQAFFIRGLFKHIPDPTVTETDLLHHKLRTVGRLLQVTLRACVETGAMTFDDLLTHLVATESTVCVEAVYKWSRDPEEKHERVSHVFLVCTFVAEVRSSRTCPDPGDCCPKNTTR